MGTFDKVSPGDTFQMSADTHNAMIDAARAHRNAGSDAGGLRVHNTRPGMALVINSSGVDQTQYAVLGIGGVGILPSLDEDHFKLDVILTVELPGADHRGRFCVLAEPIPIDAMGWAYVDDVVQVRLDVKAVAVDDDPMRAEIVEGDATKLQTSTFGSAQVLWWEKRGAVLPEVPTGEQWAIVRLGSQPVTFPVELEAVAGLAGDNYSGCTFVYDVKDPWTGALLPMAGSVSADPVASPHAWQRPLFGEMRAATAGIATIAKDDKVRLLWINETPVKVPTTFAMDFAKVGGSEGTPAAPCTFTYDVSDPATGGVKLSGVSPVAAPHRWLRPDTGTRNPATAGICQLDGTGGVIILWCNEQPKKDNA